MEKDTQEVTTTSQTDEITNRTVSDELLHSDMSQEEVEIAEEKQRLHKKKMKKIMTLAVIVLLLGAGATTAYFVYFKKEDTTGTESNASFVQMNNGSTYVSATGTTAIGMNAEEFPIDFLDDTDMKVDEVYLDSGDVVEAGTKYIKFTDSSIKDARKELEDASLTASITYRNSVISTQISKIEAKYNYQKTLLEGQQAQGVYDDKIAELEQNLSEAEDAYNEAEDDLTELQDNLTNNGFYDEYDIDAKKKAYEDNKELYDEVYDKWGDISTTTTETASANAQPGAQQLTVDSEKPWKEKALTLIKEEYEESKSEYEKAMSDYDDAMENYELQLKQLQNKVDSTSQAYEEAQLTYQKESLSAKTTLETALEKAKTAEMNYNTQITSLDESLSKLADEESDASDNLALFEETVGDGYLYTDGAGTIMRVMAEAGDTLTGGNVVIAYQDASKLTVSVSVSQEYISQISVGESAYVSITDAGDFDGTVTSINPVSSSTSRTSIAYTVEITLDGDISELSQNLTANVVFGTTMDEMSNQNMGQGGPKGGRN